MKWFIRFVCLVALLVPALAFAECDFAWNSVAGNTYTLADYTVQFSEAYAGPCPQGKVDVYADINELPVLTCTYMTYCGQRIVITCDGTDLNFIYCNGKLTYVEFTDTVMELETLE